MIEMISAGLALIAAHILFERSGLGKKLTPWKSIGISILVISLSLVIFVLSGSKFVFIVIVTTVFCGVFVSTRYRDYLMSLARSKKL
ncbi:MULTISPECIES: hypothetical protein [Bacillaceae]|uniref:hypothetical protein n=1 Tax=Bacillaceae TaxID=186817 RepID=UPI00101B877B|nr:hypothetical protein [Ectobacillus funiculus]